MKFKIHILLSIVTVGIMSLACGLLTTPAGPPTDTEPAIQVETGEPPTVEPAPQPTAEANLPAGLATIQDEIVSFYDLNGAQVSQVQLPQSTFLQADRIHIAGGMPASGGAVPLLYFSFDTGESLHFRDGNGQIFALMDGASFLGLTGVPAQPVVAFSQVEFLETSLRSKIYVGSIQSLSSAAPVSVIDDPESWAIKPILVEAKNGTPTKVWYTRVAYGIGGDIVFEPRKGLSVLDLATGQVDTLLEDTISPWAISTDRDWAVYSSGLFPPNPICMNTLGTGVEVCFPQLPASDSRGTGEAVLSPDAGYVAWMEGDGWLMAETPNFTSTVRVGQRDGTILADLPMSKFEGAAGVGSVSRAEPVAWLDNQTLLVQVRGQEWSQVALLRYNVLNGEISYQVPGEFLGVVYP
jgi:hypothetical protein